jgi:hypothetical protein
MITRPTNKKIAGIVILAVLICVLALSQAGIAGRITRASISQDEKTTHQMLMPLVFSRGYANGTLKGTVLDTNGQPVARVTVVTNDGRYAYTDKDGGYTFKDVPEGTYVVSATKYGYDFFPERRTVKMDRFSDQENFDANQTTQCYEDIANSDFEVIGAWTIPPTFYSAGYSQVQANSGIQSMRTGIIDPTVNKYSYSDFRQAVTIPYNATSATLRFWIYPSSGEPTPLAVAKPEVGMNIKEVTLSVDVQYLVILDAYYNILETMLWQRENTQTWTLVERNLMGYAGRTVYLQYGTFNNGFDGTTSMFVDDVSVEICDHSATTNTVAGKVTYSDGVPASGVTLTTNTGLVTSTDSAGNYSFTNLAAGSYTITPSKPGFTFTPGSLTATVPPDQLGQNFTANLTAACYQEFANNDMETDTAWEIPVTAYTAGYTAVTANGGSRSMRTGIDIPADNRYSYSPFRQTAIIPVTAARVTLDYWMYPVSSETTTVSVPEEPQLWAYFEEIGSTLAGDVQYLLILNQYNQIVERIMWERTNSQVWSNRIVDLSKYAGWIIKTHFGTYNDGLGGITTNYVDDVYLEICVP